MTGRGEVAPYSAAIATVAVGGAISARLRCGASGCQPSTRQHDEEADHIGNGHVPAVPQPQADRLWLRDTCWTAPRRPTSRTRSSSRRSRPHRRGSPSRSRPVSAPARSAGYCRTPPRRSRVRARSARTPAAASRPASARPHITSASRKMLPLKRLGHASPSRACATGRCRADRRPHGQADEREAARAARDSAGWRSRWRRWRRRGSATTMNTRIQSTRTPRGASLMIGE